VNTRRVVYCLICAVILYSATVTASQYADYSRRPLSEMLEVYSKFEASFQAGSNYNVGAAAALMAAIGKKGGREVFPFLEEKILAPVTPAFVRSAAAEIYASLATGEECAEFLPKILAIGNEEKSAGGWRNRVTPVCLAKIDAGIATHELSDESVARFMAALLTFAQSTDNSWEAKNADDFLSKHCEGYPMSKQRVALWHAIVTTGNEWSKEKYAPLSQSLETIPPSKRIDLRKRFPDLPPLPDDAPARSPVKVALAIIAGGVALAVCAVAAWLAVRRRRVRETK